MTKVTETKTLTPAQFLDEAMGAINETRGPYARHYFDHDGSPMPRFIYVIRVTKTRDPEGVPRAFFHDQIYKTSEETMREYLEKLSKHAEEFYIKFTGPVDCIREYRIKNP